MVRLVLVRSVLGCALGLTLTVSTLGVASGAGLVPGGDHPAPSRQVRDFDPHDGASVARLVAATVRGPGMALRARGGGFVSEGASGTGVQVTGSGRTALTGPDGRVTITPAPAAAVGVSGGTVVHEDIASSTDLVTRAVPGGVQLVAVLADRRAPSRIPFRLDLPAGWTLRALPGGSVQVVSGPTEPSAGPTRGGLSADARPGGMGQPGPSRDGRARAGAGAAGPGRGERDHPVAVITAPWALDAMGVAVPTHFEVHGHDVVQVVEIGRATVFPVTADPNVLWWAWTAAECAATLAPFVLGGATVVASRLARIQRYIDSSKRLQKGLKNLGGLRGLLKATRNAALGVARGSLYRYLTRKEVLALSAMGAGFMNLLGDLLGIGSCVSLLREAL